MDEEELKKHRKKNWKHPPPEAEVCYNCESIWWGIGIGQGLRCKNLNNREDPDKMIPLIPSRWHSCEYFCKKRRCCK